ncbi:hypothetical protein GCM10022198_00800 [Klugiella xanthotipulae]
MRDPEDAHEFIWTHRKRRVAPSYVAGMPWGSRSFKTRPEDFDATNRNASFKGATRLVAKSTREQYYLVRDTQRKIRTARARG